jgi:hypothetical protein
LANLIGSAFAVVASMKNPDDEILRKMKQVASSFAANVVGDEGEQY